MAEAIDQILYTTQKRRFLEIEKLSRDFSDRYSGDRIIRESIFSVAKNYAREMDLPLEIMRYPFHDDKLWAFTFLKKGTIFVCVNSALAMCRQIFAAAHELYHVYCFGEDTDQNTIRNGSLLNAAAIDASGIGQEELEANAFAGLLLMPASAVRDQMCVQGMDAANLSLDNVLGMMDSFAVPYKACVLRLYECKVLGLSRAREFYSEECKTVLSRINLTGMARRWCLDGKGMEIFGSLMEDFAYNEENELLTPSRMMSDRDYLNQLRKRYSLNDSLNVEEAG